MAGITEEVSTASKDISEKQDEATTVYEREEQKYIAEEKEVVTSYQEVEEEFSSVTNQIIATSEMKEEIFKIEKDKDLTDEIQAHRIEKEEDIIMKLAQSQLAEEEIRIEQEEIRKDYEHMVSSEAEESQPFETTESVTGKTSISISIPFIV